MSTSLRAADLAKQADYLLSAGRLEQAIAIYEKALALNPKLSDAWFNLGWALRTRRRFESAVYAYRQALHNGVRDPESVRLNLAAILSDHLYKPEAAEAELNLALAQAPGFVPASLSLGALYEDFGKSDAARDVYQGVLKHTPGNGRAVARLAIIDLNEGNHRSASVMLDAALANAASSTDAIEILYAKAATLDADGQYDAAFDSLAAAHSLAQQGKGDRYDPQAQEDFVSKMIEAFPRANRQKIVSNDALKPVFVVGMFRSGSTLTEQLLGRHGAITAAGELEYIPAITRSGLASYPQGSMHMDTATIRALRQGYFTEIERAVASGVVTDKRCDNVMHLGLISTIFPEAPIIHTTRDPLDTLVSVLFTHFGDGVNYGQRQRDAAHYYIQYRRMLDHWVQLYGAQIHDVDYGRLVLDPRCEIEGVLTFLGLPWDEACVVQNDASRPVRTPSSWQVRKPVHQKSLGRWHHYARQLQPARQLLTEAGLH